MISAVRPRGPLQNAAWSAPTYSSFKTLFPEAAGTTLKIAVPAGTKKGACLIAPVQVESKVTIAGPGSGWVEIAEQRQSAVENFTVSAWILPIWDGTTEYTWTWGGASHNRLGHIVAIDGADPVDPLGAVSNAQIKECAPASTVATFDAFSTTTANNRVFQFVYNNYGRTNTPAAGYTEIADQSNGPAVNYKTAATLTASEVAKVEQTVASQETMTLSFSLQPPQVVEEEEGEEFKVTLEETITINDALTKGAGKVLGETVTINDALTRKADYKLVLSETATINDAIARGIAKALPETVTINDALSKGAGKVLKETVTISDELGAELGLPGGVYVNIEGNWVLTGIRVF